MMSMFLALFALVCVFDTNTTAQSREHESRQTELHKLVLDLQNPAVVVCIALRPGTEDFNALSFLQNVRGAKVTTVFVTNGESVPNDRANENWRFTAGRRKEEAYQAATYLGTQAYFLNLPDPGVLSNEMALKSLWNSDTLVERFSSVLESFHPDFVFLMRDVILNEGSALSSRYLQQALLRAVEGADSGAGPMKKGVAVSRQQPSPRVFVDDGQADQKFRFDDATRLPGPRETAAERGRKAAAFYESVQWRMKGMTSVQRKYTLIQPQFKSLPRFFDSGITIVPAALRSIASGIGTFTRELGRHRTDDVLNHLQALVDTIDRALHTQSANLSVHDQGILARWKNGMEDLRCNLLGVECNASVSDSLVANSQLFYFDIKSFGPKTKPKSSDLFIPKINDVEWIVNETLDKRFPLEVPVQYRILAPENLPLNAPNWSRGLMASRMRLGFFFFIIHRDSIRERNFIYRKEIPMRTSPAQAFELLSDAVMVSPGEPLSFRVQSVSRDRVRGRIIVRDTVIESATKTFFVPGRSEFVDTVQLRWKNDVPTGDYAGEVLVSQKDKRSFVARKFPCKTEGHGAIGVVSSFPQSTLAMAVRRIGLTPIVLRFGAEDNVKLSDFHTIVIGRDEFAANVRLSGEEDSLWRWVRAGGHLILLSQFHTRPSPFSAQGLSRFQEGKSLDTFAELEMDSTNEIMRVPNVLSSRDWDDWVSAKTYGFLVPGESASDILVRAKESGLPLITSMRVGQGLIICVALDLETQLSDIVPGAYRILANLVGTN